MSNGKRGRPRGSKNNKRKIVDAVSSVCPTCGSSKRAPYHGKIERDISGTAPDGRIYDSVVWRRTACLDCGQHRVDRDFIFPSVPDKNYHTGPNMSPAQLRRRHKRIMEEIDATGS